MSWVKHIVDYFERRHQERIKAAEKAAEHKRLSKDWVLVYQNEEFTWGHDGQENKDTISIALFENGLRERKYELIPHFNANADTMARIRKTAVQNKTFITDYLAWLNGHEREDIPTYQQVKNDNVMTNLKR